MKLLSRGQSLSARLFVALPCCHSLMVPRRIGDVSCGENHTVWQTQRRHEEGSSHPCSLEQWSHQKLLTCFAFFVLWRSYSKKKKKKKKTGQKSQTNSLTNLFGKEINGCPNIATDDRTDTVGVNPRVLGSQCGPAPVKCAVWEETLWWRIYGSAVTLLLCSQPLPEAANGFAH